MFERDYYRNHQCREYEATVLTCEGLSQEEQERLALPREALYRVRISPHYFYARGGGQPGDTGYLGEARVTDCCEEDGQLWLYCDRSVCGEKRLAARIDYERRYDFMQQHSAEHLISGTAHRLFGAENVGFHMNREFSTMDLDQELSDEEILRLETEVNLLCEKALPIREHIGRAEDFVGLPYRSKKSFTGEIRLVEIEGADLCACCGLQVEHTGAIGSIQFLHWEKYKGGLRLCFAAGRRALDIRRKQRDILKRLVRELSRPEEELCAALREQKLRQEKLKMRLERAEREEWQKLSRKYGGTEAPLVLILPSLISCSDNKKILSDLAEELAVRRRFVLLLAEGDEQQASRFFLRCRASLSPEEAEEAEQLTEEWMRRPFVRGGGRGLLRSGRIEETFEVVLEALRAFPALTLADERG